MLVFPAFLVELLHRLAPDLAAPEWDDDDLPDEDDLFDDDELYADDVDDAPIVFPDDRH